MGLTPDRYPGPRIEESLQLQEDTTDPAVEGEVKNVQGVFRAKDEDGVFGLRRGAHPKLYLHGLNAIWASVSSVQISAGIGRSDDDADDIEATSAITISIASSGANGLDTGSEASSTWYYIWAIKNPSTSTVAGLLSASATSPTMPSGYTLKRLVGSVRNNASSNFLKFKQCGNGTSRRTFYDESSWTYLMLLSGGDATSWADVDCSSLIPATSTVGYFFLNAWLGNGNLRPNGSSANPIIQIQPGEGCVFWMLTDSSQVVEYICASSPQGYLDVHGHGYGEEL